MKVQIQTTIDPTVLEDARKYIGYGNISKTVERLLKKEIEKKKRSLQWIYTVEYKYL